MSRVEESTSVPGEELDLPSGRLLVRMPRTLHAELARVAEQEGMSLNGLIVAALASSVGWRDGAGHRGRSEKGSRFIPMALLVNLAVVIVAAAVAIGLLIVAWRGA